ncbi:MAG: hypothetical protein WCA27_29595 [Candidatus Sulfotelmatobacter sp.]
MTSVIAAFSAMRPPVKCDWFFDLSALSYRVTSLAKNLSNLAQTAGEPIR